MNQSLTQAPLLEIKDLSKSYERGGQKILALRGVSLTAHQGEFTSIMGPSGSGKSTLLHLIGHLDRPTSGQLLVQGQDLSTKPDEEVSIFRRRHLGFIFQFFHLMPHLTALENVLFPILLDGDSAKNHQDEAKRLLDAVGLQNRYSHFPGELSGGQMQRVAIARALIARPHLILADEPTGNLDSQTGREILDLLRKIVQTQNQTVIMVTHDASAGRVGHRLIELRDGVIEKETRF